MLCDNDTTSDGSKCLIIVHELILHGSSDTQVSWLSGYLYEPDWAMVLRDFLEGGTSCSESLIRRALSSVLMREIVLQC